MAAQLILPIGGRGTRTYSLRPDPPSALTNAAPPQSRKVFAAAHVVADPLSTEPWLTVDWDATLAFRHHLWDLGFGVADAMDTAQRGMGLPPAAVAELIRRSLAAAADRGAAIACGAATDALATGGISLRQITDAYLAQCELIEGGGGQVVLMASRQLAVAAAGPGDYHDVYSHVLQRLHRPAILHWLGPAFDPALAGYWGSATVKGATDSLVRIIEDNAEKVDGVKISLLDVDAELALRRRLPPGVRLYTGDDFHYPELIRGDEHGHSDALLGIFDAIAPVAAAAFAALDSGDGERFDALLAPTVTLSRTLFEAPTYHYKTGIVFLAYLTGRQRHFRMIAGQESARSILHLAEVFRLADEAGLLVDQDLAVARMRPVLTLAGIDQP
ncbi:dihydrodipicolinate synthase family protein [Nakamurella lactea]|uniref:dihydrodipicolinate synthase family protein n=1 Tax=Nakamurella lactea TaxID=459515 RepID=UPI00041C2CB7|nr:dihydrodipicolinate synthase family protein [Nakamurella lactea]